MSDSTKNFIVYKSSAGSGKTYTLVKEYLKIVLVDPSKFRQVLAVTFTNKAAYEMKNRIITYLLLLSDLAGKNTSAEKIENIRKQYAELIQNLSESTGLNEISLAGQALIVLQKILHNYSDFAISTIDSFVQRIIRTFAYDLKIPQNFEVELDSKRILSEAVDVLLSYAGSDEEITKMLIQFIKQKMDDGQNWDIESDLKKFSEQLLKEDTQKYIGLFSDYTLADFSKIIKSAYVQLNFLKNDAFEQANLVIKAIEDCQIDPKSFYQGSRGIPAFFYKVIKKGLAAADTNSYYEKTINEGLWCSKSASESDKRSIESLETLITEAYYSINRQKQKYLDICLIINSLYPLSLLSQIEKEVETIKAEENMIFISDFYRKIHEQLLNEPVPFIYQRAGEKYEHFFIDEFQDTSVLQFQNMLPLIENSMASGNANLIVGDGKQAIYRWRNGEVMQFVSLPQIFNKPALPHFDDIEQALSRNIINYTDYETGAKNINFRSQAEIVDFNNGLFTFLASEILDADKQQIYLNISQQLKPGNDSGYVNINFFESGETYVENQLNRILQIINSITEKDIQLKDIAVICRANQKAADVAAHLLNNGIDVVSSESLLLCSSPKVNLLVSIFRYINNPDDELAAAFVMFYLQKFFTSEYSFNQLIQTYHAVKKNHHQKYSLTEIFKLFNIELSFNIISFLPLYDMTEELIRIFSFNKYADPFIVYFLDAVNEFIQKRTPSIFDFMEWWDETGAKKSIVVPDKLNAVKIMTIHKAKGLEFPIVIYPFADESDKVKGASTWVEYSDDNFPGLSAFPINIAKNKLEGSSFEKYYHEEKNKVRLDMLNICYVALTRPENQLYILTKKNEKTESISFGNLLKKYLIHINKWIEDIDVYEFGNPSMSEIRKHIEKNNTVIPEVLVSSDWTNKMLIRYNSSLLWGDDDAGKSISWGNIIHAILSEIHQTDDTSFVIRKMVLEGVITEENAEIIRKYIDELMSKPEFNKFFEQGLNVMTESEILTPENKLYRPDRIILEEQKNIVIDFKTGAEKEEHKSQINNYAELLSEINGKPSEKYLIYLHDNVKLFKVV